MHTLCRRLLSVVAILACSMPIETRAAHANQGGLTISGVVLEHDEKTTVPNMRLQLRNIDTGAVVAQTVSGPDGSYSFDVGQPGIYVVEAVDAHGVRAITKPTPTGAATVVNVILPSTRVAAIAAIGAYGAVAAAVTAGALAFGGGRGAISPER